MLSVQGCDIHTFTDDNYSQIIRPNPSQADKYFNKGFALYLLDNYPECIRELEKTIKKQDNDAEALFYLGMAYARSGNASQATGHFDKSLRTETPKTSHYNLSYMYFVMGRFNEALDECNEALTCKEPHIVNIHMNMATIYTNIGLYQESIAAYNNALKADMNIAKLYNVYYYISISYQKLGDNKNAIDVLNKAVTLNPGLIQGYYDLGLLYIKEHNEKMVLVQYNILKNMNEKLADELYNRFIESKNASKD